MPRFLHNPFNARDEIFDLEFLAVHINKTYFKNNWANLKVAIRFVLDRVSTRTRQLLWISLVSIFFSNNQAWGQPKGECEGFDELGKLNLIFEKIDAMELVESDQLLRRSVIGGCEKPRFEFTKSVYDDLISFHKLVERIFPKIQSEILFQLTTSMLNPEVRPANYELRDFLAENLSELSPMVSRGLSGYRFWSYHAIQSTSNPYNIFVQALALSEYQKDGKGAVSLGELLKAVPVRRLDGATPVSRRFFYVGEGEAMVRFVLPPCSNSSPQSRVFDLYFDGELGTWKQVDFSLQLGEWFLGGVSEMDLLIDQGAELTLFDAFVFQQNLNDDEFIRDAQIAGMSLEIPDMKSKECEF